MMGIENRGEVGAGEMSIKGKFDGVRRRDGHRGSGRWRASRWWASGMRSPQLRGEERRWASGCARRRAVWMRGVQVTRLGP